MLPVPPCRHRGAEFAPDRFVCTSSRLVLPRGAGAEICSHQCWCVNHETAGQSPCASRRAAADSPQDRVATRHGVVIGTYDSLVGSQRIGVQAVRLNLAVLRANCGPDVPLLVCDDASPPESQRRYRVVCRQYGAEFHSNRKRWGHTSGDMAVFHGAIVWGKRRGLRTVTKLSQRMMIDVAGWLRHDADRLLASGHGTHAQLLTNYPTDQIRTECVMMDVDAWSRPEVLKFLRPRRIDWWNEGHVFRAIRELVDRDRPYPGFLPWPRLSYRRGGDSPPVYFRDMAGNPFEHFENLAGKYGVSLAEGFSTIDSVGTADYRNW